MVASYIACGLAASNTLGIQGWALGEREGYGGPCDVTSLSLSLQASRGAGLAGLSLLVSYSR